MDDSDILLGGPPLELFHSDLHLSDELESTDGRHKYSSTETIGSSSSETFENSDNSCDNCHNADKMYERMQQAIDCVCGTTGTTSTTGATGSLCQAVQASNLVNTAPFKSMIELITGPYSTCGAVIPPEQRQAAYDSFTSITGYTPPNLTKLVTVISNSQKNLANYTALYVFLILLTIAIIVLVMLVLVGVFTWSTGIILAVVAFLIIYSISLAYSFGAQRMINDQSSQILDAVTNEQSNFQNTVAYWPQGLFGIASALTATGTTGIWPCNTTSTNTSSTQVVGDKEFQLSSSNLSSELPLSALSIEDVSSLNNNSPRTKKPNKPNKLKHNVPIKLGKTTMKLGSKNRSRFRVSSRLGRLK